MCQFVQRYGNPRYCGEEYTAFANTFRSSAAVAFLTPTMTLLQLKSQGSFVTDDVMRMCLSFVSSCVEMSPTYKVIKPHLSFLLLQVMFPAMCLTEEELRLFQDDPAEFVRKVCQLTILFVAIYCDVFCMFFCWCCLFFNLCIFHM